MLSGLLGFSKIIEVGPQIGLEFVSENYRLAAGYIDQILRGTKVADLPFQEPTRLTLSINLGTARTLRIAVPPSLLARADEVIE
jgi:putative ABC transport system substrate-binding protein